MKKNKLRLVAFIYGVAIVTAMFLMYINKTATSVIVGTVIIVLEFIWIGRKSFVLYVEKGIKN